MRRQSKIAAGVLAAAAVLMGVWGPGVAAARGALYMKLSGVTGDVMATGYLGDIDIGSYALSVTDPVSSPTGGATHRTTGGPNFSDLSVTAQGSASSVAILTQMLGGRPFDTLNLYLTKRSGKMEEDVTFAEWDFDNAYVTSFGTADGGEVPADEYKFAFDSFTYKWFNLDQSGQPIGHVEIAYDVTLQKVTTSLMEGDVTGFSMLSAVPEPGCAVMAVVGLVGAVGGRRRRK